jgi:hypothetical protein
MSRLDYCRANLKVFIKQEEKRKLKEIIEKRQKEMQNLPPLVVKNDSTPQEVKSVAAGLGPCLLRVYRPTNMEVRGSACVRCASDSFAEEKNWVGGLAGH